MRVLIVGDSHTGALNRGHERLVDDDRLPEGIHFDIHPLGSGARMHTAFWTQEGDVAVLTDPIYRRRIPVLPPDPHPDAIGMSMPLWSGRVMRGLLQQGRTVAGLPAAQSGAGPLISAAMLRVLVARDMAPALRLAEFLAGQGIPVFVIEPPAAFRAYRYVRHAGAEAVVALQSAIRQLQRDAIGAAGLPIVNQPAEMLDPDGFTAEVHAHEDPSDSHHGNAAFGALMLEACVPLLRQIASSAKDTHVASL
ncbi:hypothetical protein LCM17_03145 [Cereibacter sphaeroides]|nr:hypothetical protein [Cereibacter sphaeroides]